MKAAHLKQGEDAENACCQYLKSQGLKLIERNFRSTYGEIDLIMMDKTTLVFVEVRFRKNKDFGGGLESVTKTKQNKLRKTAELYIQKHNQSINARFDVVSMSKQTHNTPGKQQYTYNWITNAF